MSGADSKLLLVSDLFFSVSFANLIFVLSIHFILPSMRIIHLISDTTARLKAA